MSVSRKRTEETGRESGGVGGREEEEGEGERRTYSVSESHSLYIANHFLMLGVFVREVGECLRYRHL